MTHLLRNLIIGLQDILLRNNYAFQIFEKILRRKPSSHKRRRLKNFSPPPSHYKNEISPGIVGICTCVISKARVILSEHWVGTKEVKFKVYFIIVWKSYDSKIHVK